MAGRQTSGAKTVMMTKAVILFGLFAVSVGVARYFDLGFYWFGPGTGFPRKPGHDQPIARGPDATIELSKMVQLRSLLEEQQFVSLNAELDTYHKAFESDHTREIALGDVFEVFSVTLPHYSKIFDKWIKDHPDQYQPYLAAAHYYYELGWQRRGYKFAKETPADNFRGMRENFRIAKEKLDMALAINPNAMLAYNILMGIYNARGDEPAERQTIEKATGLFPRSYLVWSTAMWCNQPRWGGSYAQMVTLADKAQACADDYPLLRALYGSVYEEQARVYEKKKKYRKALRAINKAILFGDRFSFFEQRADLYAFYLDDQDRAIEDINYAIALRPTHTGSYLTRAGIHFLHKDYERVGEDLALIDYLHPQDRSKLKWCRWAARNLNNEGHLMFEKDIKGARQRYTLSLNFDPGNPDTYYWRGNVNYRLMRYEKALVDLKKCIEVDPHYFEAYRLIDYTLKEDKQWDTIISYWDRFLELEPDHAEAYFERAGTHFHNKNPKAAKADAQKACDLGNEKACYRLQSMK